MLEEEAGYLASNLRSWDIGIDWPPGKKNLKFSNQTRGKPESGLRKLWVCMCVHLAVQWFCLRGEGTVEEAGAPLGSTESWRGRHLVSWHLSNQGASLLGSLLKM